MPGAEDILRPGDSDGPESSDAGHAGPRTVGGYRLLRRVGEGGMSTVFLSYDVPGRRAVAVKILADHLASQREFVNRFYREARLSRLLYHPNIVQGLAAGYDPVAVKHYLVLEFIDGPSAHTALTQLGRLPVGVAVKIGIDIARALDFLHGRNYVHRDVKPDNILLPPDGGAKLADLGLTKRLNDDTHLTWIHQGVGTSYYMPYEQAMNAAMVDGRSDIFALGATLYHLLTGQVPFPGATHEEVVREKEHDVFRPLRELNPNVPPALEEIVAAMLARDPRARFQRAENLAVALEQTGLATPIPPFLASSPTEESPVVDLPTRADLTAGGTPPEPPDPEPPADETRRDPDHPTDRPRIDRPRILPLVLTVVLTTLGPVLARHAPSAPVHTSKAGTNRPPSAGLLPSRPQ